MLSWTVFLLALSAVGVLAAGCVGYVYGDLARAGAAAVAAASASPGGTERPHAHARQDGDGADRAGGGAGRASAPGFGEAVRTGPLVATVTGVEYGCGPLDPVIDDIEGTCVLVYLEIANTGTRAYRPVAEFQTLVAAGGGRHPGDTRLSLAADHGGLFDAVPPGESRDGVLVFEIAYDVNARSIELRASADTPGVQVRLAH
ncbi:DUF4352 domain-containing protein [Allonocardiopsis opalescens]|uniref:Uncharacterized protein DUF4352 n=1 Tax=Allonocardiopsis opalescens TaxID=1144618 RepID=A0A2T0Q0I0_9ACTN|nr:DUF4352 domain-containing protein [Allonocardiopsis opalescens]PRX97215.1 uncharacterized protein DUF4352 [Allonocardiopsis opalescens]